MTALVIRVDGTAELDDRETAQVLTDFIPSSRMTLRHVVDGDVKCLSIFEVDSKQINQTAMQVVATVSPAWVQMTGTVVICGLEDDLAHALLEAVRDL